MATSASLNYLERHQARRASGVPTFGVLAGPVGLGVRAWREWATHNRRPCVVAAEGAHEAILTSWVEALFGVSSPRDQARDWLAKLVTQSGRETPDISRLTRFDLDQLFRSLPIDLSRAGATAAQFILVDELTGTQTTAAQFVRRMSGEAGRSDGLTRVVQAVAELSAPELRPALLLVCDEESVTERAKVLERIATVEPEVPVALSLSITEFAKLTTAEPQTRLTVLMREGFVELQGVSGNQLERQFRDAGIAPPPPAVRERLADNGLAIEVAGSFVAATRSVRSPTVPELASDFRSVHEGFLFDILESMPQTAGLFRPNQPLGFRHGRVPAEADLLAATLKLVVEVDGSHYHLVADQYRRDRKKDWLYQRHGYTVLRFLAEDVVEDLEYVLNTILEAVEFRRRAHE